MACAALMSLAMAAPAASPPRHEPLPVAGFVERARISPGEVVLEAKLDTGALTSSLHATQLRKFERDGSEWLAFDVVGNDGRTVHIERPLVRIARVKSALGTDAARPTVTLGVCIGTVYRVTEVSLVDRADLTHPLLVGRRFLRGRLLVDSHATHMFEPACKEKAVP
jgi:hypothetical protein